MYEYSDPHITCSPISPKIFVCSSRINVSAIPALQHYLYVSFGDYKITIKEQFSKRRQVKFHHFSGNTKKYSSTVTDTFTCVSQHLFGCIFSEMYGVTKKCFRSKNAQKNSLINLLRKFQLRLHSWSITINTQTNFQIISQYRIFCETCPTLVQNAILWNNAPAWLNKFSNQFVQNCTRALQK